MFDVAWNTLDLARVEWGYALALTALCVIATLVGIVNRTHRLLEVYYVGGDWPGVIHPSEKGLWALCGACGHHLTVHDRATGRCCYGIPLDHLAVIIALPMPLLLRDVLQKAGCPCRVKTSQT